MRNLDRVRYYDGEFLRASDFSDEQSYHVEMRRRINRYLHLYGIVQGLQLQNDNSAGVSQVSILSGMAIDAFGREIYVFQPKTLGDADISNNRISQPGQYDVWLRYNKAASTPPSAGYSSCNQMNQYTRWGESFSVVLLASPSQPFTNPGFAVDDTDDPSQDQVGVLLGTVNIDLASASGVFYGAAFDPNRCQLLGVIAQTIQVPPSWDVTQGNPPPFSFLNTNTPGIANTPLSPPASLEIVPNLFADQNLIVGRDFPLTYPQNGPTTITFNPSTSGEPAAGNVKIAGDLFVKGNIYSPTVTGTTITWNGISALVQQLVQQLVPDVLVDSQVAKIPASPPDPVSSFTRSNTLTTTRLNKISKVIPVAFVQSSSFDPSIPQGGDLVGLSIDSIQFSLVSNTQCTVTANWTAGPVNGGKCAIPTFTIFFIAVCFP